ncbi:ThuA domain-containing protein [Vallitalea guaymasensis]|uniref:ThuA domain-containing protein n=1 Tax=Vallitalea guaymasensis TaxID=1185412 RepID=UPI00272D78C9|nr:ThuA domain-containing protein [Vallitalea guaymasensis]
MKKALIIYGGWEGHDPDGVAKVFENTLIDCNFEVEVFDTLDILLDTERLKTYHIIVPIWTMGTITDKQMKSISQAVAHGVGLAGCHGGMCDAFRDNVDWQFMTGGNWVSHPGGDLVEYEVNIKNSSSKIVEDIQDFRVKSEQYYLHVDPAIEVLATTRFPIADGLHSLNGYVDMPVVWTKRWGKGRVFYNSLGHQSDIFNIPEAIELMKRGFMWVAEGKDKCINEYKDCGV